MRVFSGNLYNNLIAGIPQTVNRTTEYQLQHLVDQEAELYLVQEQSGRELDRYTRALGPAMASHMMRFFANDALSTSQGLAIFSQHPIACSFGQNLGYLHADRQETEPELVGLGREVQAAALAAEVEHPLGNYWAITAHLAWTRQAHLGLQPHQIDCMRRLKEFLASLSRLKDLPIVMGADCNALVEKCDAMLPGIQLIVHPSFRDSMGTSLDLDDPVKMKHLAEKKVVIDGLFASHHFKCHGLKTVTEVSDHKGYLAILNR